MNFTKYDFLAAELPPEGRLATFRRRFHIWRSHKEVVLMGNQIDGYWYVPRAWRNYFLRFSQLRGLAPYVSDHIVIVFDRKRQRVHRLSLDHIGNQRIANNTDFLRQSHSIQRPFSHRFVARPPFYYSTETLIEGGVLRATGISGSHINEIIDAISPLYTAECRKRVFAPKAIIKRFSELEISETARPYTNKLDALVSKRLEHWSGQSLIWSTIHGDLVHRNVIEQSDGNYVFIDGDRSEYLFPEIDILTLVLFWQVHQRREQTRTLIPFINRSVNILEAARPHLNHFYKSQPAFKPNKQHEKLFQIILIYRIAMYGVHNFSHPNDQNKAKRLIEAAISAVERV